jgi:transposase
VGQVAPELLSLAGIGTDHTATLLSVAGDNPKRLRSEPSSPESVRSVARGSLLCKGVVRHRLNRGGNPETNRALCR